ncbi:MAG TPA: VOC family protein [Geminicoccaceae bacterium]|nr:VOC family protein [Geminicoccaceae bacterium]
MSTRLRGLDHAIIGVRDLEAARVGWARLGFNSAPRGRHLGWGTANYCIMFETGYLELLGIVDASQFTNRLDRFLAEREGLLGLALATDDADATQRGWAEAGLEPSPPQVLKRLLEAGPDPLELRFENVMLDPAATGGVSIFACRHLTPDLLRRPPWLAHPNGALGISSCTIVTRRTGPLVEAMARIFGAGSLTRTDEVWAVHAGGTVLLLATPDDAELLHPGFPLTEPDDGPLLQVLAVKVEDPERAATFLSRQGVAFGRDAAGGVLVQPAEANGVCLELVRR